jgi:hypothetical protein
MPAFPERTRRASPPTPRAIQRCRNAQQGSKVRRFSFQATRAREWENVAEILEGEIELVADLIPHDAADADPARLRQRLQAPPHSLDREDVVLLNDDLA